MSRLQGIPANQAAFLDMLAFSEGTINYGQDDGYNVLVGGGLFDSYADHPRIVVQVRPGLASSAAGRYQLLARYFNHYRDLLGLSDFGPEAQDAIALQQIKECRAIPLIDAGDFDRAIAACRHIWASLPGAGYGQYERSPGSLRTAYINAGGKFA